jgi:hypothetical protein
MTTQSFAYWQDLLMDLPERGHDPVGLHITQTLVVFAQAQ